MNILITGAWLEAKQFISEIENMGHKVCFMQHEKEMLPCEYAWVEGVICNGLFISHAIEDFTNLKYIQLTSAGYDRVPMEYVKEHNIEIHSAKGVYGIPMAEFAVCGVLELYKQSRFFAENQKAHKWEKHRGLTELCGKTVCVMGCGNVGTECAKRFKAFGCRIFGVDLFPRKDDNYDCMSGLDGMDEMLHQADVLVITLPLTEQTAKIIDGQKLSLLKSGAVLVNIARGGVIDTEALIKSLPNLGGAVLDVFEDEPLPASSPLWDMDNVIITPHNSFVGDANNSRLINVILNNL